MQRLAPADYDLLLDQVQELHSVRHLTTLRLWLLESALPRLVPSDWFSYNEIHPRSPEKSVTLLRPKGEAFVPLLPRFVELAHQHPLIVRQMKHRDLTAHRISDFLPRRAYHQLELYHDVYRHLKVEYQMSASVEASRDSITAFVLSRQARDYTERDRALLEHFRKQLLVALQNLRAAELVQHATQEADHALRLHSLATITANRDGRILNHTGFALEWLGSRDFTKLPAEILRLGRRRPADLDPGSAEIRLPRAGGEVSIRAVPGSQAGAVTFVLQMNPPPPGFKSADVLGLSPRQHEVARWIGEGKTNAQIAVILGISPRTVHKHVEQIFQRLNVESRVAVAMRLVGK